MTHGCCEELMYSSTMQKRQMQITGSSCNALHYLIYVKIMMSETCLSKYWATILIICGFCVQVQSKRIVRTEFSKKSGSLQEEEDLQRNIADIERVYKQMFSVSKCGPNFSSKSQRSNSELNSCFKCAISAVALYLQLLKFKACSLAVVGASLLA